MANAVGSSKKIRSWDLLNENIKPYLPEMPQVQPLQFELQGVVDEGRSLNNEQEQVRARLRDIVQRRRELERRGEIIRRRVEAHLRGTYGYTSELLIGFGIKPRPRVVRKKAAKEQAKKAPASPETEAAGTPAPETTHT